MRGRIGRSVFAAGLIAAVGMILAGPAAANSAPPPAALWFYITTETGERLDIEGAQVWGCEDDACENPILLQSWGTCRAAQCLAADDPSAPAVVNLPESFECGPVEGEFRCHSTAFRYGRPLFRIALARGDRIWVQNAPLPLPQGYGETDHYSVRAAENELRIEATPARSAAKLPVPPFYAFFGISIAIELIVIGIYSVWRWKLDTTGVVQRLVLAGLINLLTYPVVWGFFPTLLRWNTPGLRTTAWSLAAFMLLLSALFWGIFNAGTTRRRWIWIGAAAAYMIAGVVCLFLFAFAAMYGYPRVSAGGLPTLPVLILAESYAIIAEGLLLHGFTRRQIPFRESMLLSLVMNLASFLVGLLLAW